MYNIQKYTITNQKFDTSFYAQKERKRTIFSSIYPQVPANTSLRRFEMVARAPCYIEHSCGVDIYVDGQQFVRIIFGKCKRTIIIVGRSKPFSEFVCVGSIGKATPAAFITWGWSSRVFLPITSCFKRESERKGVDDYYLHRYHDAEELTLA